MPHRSTPAPVGYFHRRRIRLVLTTMAACACLAVIPALPASAEVVGEESLQGALQSVAVSDDAGIDPVDRAAFGATEYTLVQNPVPAGTVVSSGFGYRIPPCSGCSSYHRGIDLLAGAGNPIEAIADGIVVAVGNPSGGLGVYVTIQHVIDGRTVTTTYAHMAYGSMPYSVGDSVDRGDVVGKVGSTGQSTGPHLYFQVMLADGSYVDPTAWLAKHVTSD